VSIFLYARKTWSVTLCEKHKFEGVREQGAEEDIWAYEAQSNR